jgi:peptidoglycan/xylan/chitin deacetylase (PgdA/CDA1 family)
MKFPHKLFTVFIIVLITGCNASPTENPNAAFKNTVVSLTFDDGDADNYQVRPILKENNLHATFYIVSGFTGTPNFMTAEELRGLYEDGNEIGGHTLNHTGLDSVRGADLKREVCQDRLNLLAYGFDVRSFAYPYGKYDEEAKRTVAECGYNNGRIVTDGPDSIPPTDPYALQAMPYVVRDTLFLKMKHYVTETETNGGGWVIFTFHHVCDKCDKFAVTAEAFTKLAQWLKEQQQNGLIVKTVGEVIGGEVKPRVAP